MNEQSIARKLPFLAGLLVLQVALAGLLLWRGSDKAVAVEPLLALTGQPVDRIELAAEEATVKLHKRGDLWLLGDDLPADGSRVEAMIESVAALKSGWPVASSASAQERFDVSDSKFQRKIALYSKDRTLGTLLIGSSPSFRQVHVRKSDQDEIYALNFDVHGVPANADAWLDTALLRPRGDITRISSDHRVLEKDDGAWPSAEEGGLDGEAVAKALANLKVLGLAEQIAVLDAPSEGEDTSLQKLAFKVGTNEGEYSYELLGKDGQYYIRRSDYKPLFRLSKAQYDSLAAIAASAEEASDEAQG